MKNYIKWILKNLIRRSINARNLMKHYYKQIKIENNRTSIINQKEITTNPMENAIAESQCALKRMVISPKWRKHASVEKMERKSKSSVATFMGSRIEEKVYILHDWFHWVLVKIDLYILVLFMLYSALCKIN